MDFTLMNYRQLLMALKKRGYTFLTYSDYIENNSSLVKTHSSQVTSHPSLCILRHDVDKLPGNSLTMAKIEAEFGIKGTYYFRIVPESFDEKIIKEIAEMGHEAGYHYEEMDLAYSQLKMNNEKLCSIPIISGKIRKDDAAIKKFDNDPSHFDLPAGRQDSAQDDNLRLTDSTNNQLPTAVIDLAYEMFKVNLENIRRAAEIKTICMHGSPRAKYDNKLIWMKYNYRDLGIIGEPYLDTDWKEFGYLTDTGRRWDGDKVSVRDKASTSILPQRGRRFRTTQDIIENVNSLPDKMMFTIHPQRWTNDILPWAKELVLQNVKNVVKRVIAKRPERS